MRVISTFPVFARYDDVSALSRIGVMSTAAFMKISIRDDVFTYGIIAAFRSKMTDKFRQAMLFVLLPLS